MVISFSFIIFSNIFYDIDIIIKFIISLDFFNFSDTDDRSGYNNLSLGAVG